MLSLRGEAHLNTHTHTHTPFNVLLSAECEVAEKTVGALF